MPTDPNDPSSFIDSAGKSVDQTNAVLDRMKELLKPVYDGLNKVFSKETVDNVNKLTKTVKEFDDGFSSLKDEIAETYDHINNFPELDRGGGFTKSLDSWTSRLATFGAFISSTQMFDDFSKHSIQNINDVSGSIDGIQKALSKIGVNVSIGRDLINNATQAEKLDTAYMRLAAQSGNINTVFGNTGEALRNVSAMSGLYIDKVGALAAANGQSLKNSLQFASAIDSIPGSMDATISSGDKTTNSMQKLDAAFKLISGSGRSQEDMIHTLTFAYNNLSQSQGKITDSTQKGMAMFALMSQVQNVLKIDFESVRDVMESIGQSFKNSGDETESSAKILLRYTSALRETGLTAKASMEIIKGMTSSISQMEMGTKAFLSLRSGGPGGLQGAFKIEQLLRDGKLDQVMQMAERSLKQQMGGRIYSLQEASRDPGAAAQFMRQRELVKSGAFGIGKGLDDAGATRLLEALGKGNAGKQDLQSLMSGKEAIKDVTDKGQKWEERNFNELKRVAVATELMAASFAQAGGKLVRDTVGSGRNKEAVDKSIEQMGVDRAAANNFGTKHAAMQTGQKAGDEEAIVMGIRGATKRIYDGAAGGISGVGKALEEKLRMTLSKDTNTTEQKQEIGRQATQAGSKDMTNNVVRQASTQQARDTVAAISQDKKTMEPQKIVLEIISDGQQVKIVRQSPMVDITLSKQNSGNANPGSDAGY